MYRDSNASGPTRAALLLISGLILVGCVGSRQSLDPTLAPATHEAVVEVSDPAEEAVVEEAAPMAEEPAEVAPLPVAPDVEACSLAVDCPSALSQQSVFERWLRDQSVGRHINVEALEPLCGERDGFWIAQGTLSGTGHELDSLSRALSLYFPGSRFDVRDHDRLDGTELRLRVYVDVAIPVGETPRPRCIWDSAVECP